MNREQRRKMNKVLKSTEKYDLTSISLFNKNLKDGDSIKLNVDQMMRHKDWQRLNPKYREFVMQNRDTVFTAKIRRRNQSGDPVIIDLNENDMWSFWIGDLIIIRNS